MRVLGDASVLAEDQGDDDDGAEDEENCGVDLFEEGPW